MSNDNWNCSVNRIIDWLTDTNLTQNKIDQCYDTMLKCINVELDKYVPNKYIGGETCKKLKLHKPYWDLELHKCWKEYHDCKVKSGKQKDMLPKAKILQSKFDKMLRKKEREYRHKRINDIETACTTNPNKFLELYSKPRS